MAVGASPVEDATGRAAAVVLNARSSGFPIDLAWNPNGKRTVRKHSNRQDIHYCILRGTSVTCAESLFRGTV